MSHQGHTAPSGSLSLSVSRNGGPSVPVDMELPPLRAVAFHPARELSFEEIIRYGCPQAGLHPEVNRWRRANLTNLWRGARRVLAARTLRLSHFYGALWLTHHSAEHGDLDLGLASLRVVTTAGANYIVDAFQNTTEVENFKYHGLGTGTNAEASADTALQTELTTEYATDSTRVTGSQGEGASANIYRTSATITPDSGGTLAITEHGVFSASSAGTLLDRSKFAAVNLVTPSDSLTPQYDLTIVAGS